MARSTLSRMALAAAALLTTATAQASPNEHAVDVTGNAGTVGLSFGTHTLNAQLGNSLEVDRFAFSANAGDDIRLLFQTKTGGIDPSLVLRAPTGGTVVASASCNGNDFFGFAILCSTVLDYKATSTGTFTLNVSDSGSDEAGFYQLHLDRYPPVNNWTGFAYSTPVTGELGHTTDLDFFAFNGIAGSGVTLALRTTTGGLDPVMEVWSPAGAQVSNTVCSGNDFFGFPILCTNSITIEFATTGIYRMAISDSGWNEPGAYSFEVSCLYGDCAALEAMGAPSPVPEVNSAAMILLGIPAVIMFKRRRQSNLRRPD